MKSLKNNLGFSLAELVVTMGILGGMSLYVLDMITSIKDTEKQSLAHFVISTVTMDITGALQNQEFCTETLRGLDPSQTYPNGAAIPAIRVLTGGVLGDTFRDLYTVGQVIDRQAGGGGVIQIDSMVLSNYNAAADAAEGLNRTSARQAYVTIVFKVGAAADRSDGTGIDWDTMSDAEKAEMRNRVGSNPIVVKRIPIQADLDPVTGEIDECNAGGVWSEFLSNICEDLLNGTADAGTGSCINMKIHAEVGALELTPPPHTAGAMLIADGLFRVEDAFKTQFLKVGATSTNFVMNPNFNVQLDNSLWVQNFLRVGSSDNPPANPTNVGDPGHLSYSGTFYIGQDVARTRGFRRLLRLGATNQPQGMEVWGADPTLPDPTPTVVRDAILVGSGRVLMTEPPFNTVYSAVAPVDPLSNSESQPRVDRSDAARLGWVTQTIAKTLGNNPLNVNDIMDQLKAGGAGNGEAGRVLRRYICENTQVRRFTTRDAREEVTIPAGDPSWTSGFYDSTLDQCLFGRNPEGVADDLHMKRNCSRAGNCHTIEAQTSICIAGSCRTRWPYMIQGEPCNWKASCSANERAFGSRPTAPTTARTLCCRAVLE